MVGCAVYKCKRRSNTSNSTKDRVSYHKFPKDYILRKEWITFCNRHHDWVPKRTSVICSDHFDSLSFQQSNNRRRLNECAKPTILKKNLNSNGHSSGGIAQSPSKTPSESQVLVQLQAENNGTHLNESPNPTVLNQIHVLCVCPNGDIIQCSSKTPSEPEVHTTDDQTIYETPRERNLKSQLDSKNKEIKSLQAKNRYLKQKIKDLQENLKKVKRNR